MTSEQFWELLRTSGLIPSSRLQSIAAQVSDGAGQTLDAAQMAERLVRDRHLTAYQAKMLLSGKSQFRFCEWFQIQAPRGLSEAWGRRWDAIHLPTEHPVILHLTAQEESLSCWSHERTQPLLRHLDRFYAEVQTAGRVVGLSEWPIGTNLRQRLRQRKRLGLDEACELVYQVSEALAGMHARGEIHGHLMPEEVVVSADGYVTLLRQPAGFFTRPKPPRTSPIPLERAAYCAPELADPRTVADPLSDIYALGCVFYELLTGTVPFEGATVDAILLRHAQEPIVPIHERADVPEAVNQLVSYMMAKRRGVRHASLFEVRDQLAKFLPPLWKPPSRPARPTETAYLEWEAKSDSEKGQPLGTPAVRSTPLTPSSPDAGRSSGGQDGQDKVRAEAKLGELPEELPQKTVARAAPRPADRIQIALSSPPDQRAGKSSSRNTIPERESPRVVNLNLQPPSSTKPTARAKSRESGTPGSRWSLGLTVASLLLVGLGTLAFRFFLSDPVSRDPSPASRAMTANPSDAVSSETGHPTTLAPRFDLVEDDGHTVWASPTSGDPLSLIHVPADALLLVHCRPAALMQTEEGARVARALDIQSNWERRFSELPISWQEIDSLLLAWVPGESESATLACQLFLNPDQAARVRDAWTDRQSDDRGTQGMVGAWQVGFSLQAPQTALVGSAEIVQQMLSTPEPQVRRQLAKLLPTTDATRHLTVFGSPRFLDDPTRWPASWSALREPLLVFLGENVDATQLSLQFSEAFCYAEWRVLFSADESLAARTRLLPRQLQELAERVEGLLSRMAIDPHWQPLALRFPRMLHYVAEQTRVTVDDQTLFANLVLPAEAAHNLLLASRWSLLQMGHGDSSLELTRSQPPVMEIRSLDQLLAMPMTFVVPQQSLDAAVQELAGLVRDETKVNSFRIEVRGEALQKDGITRNQQIRNLNLQTRPLREILTEITRRANPISVDDSHQPEQKVIWLPAPDQGEGPFTVWITTRTIARENGYQLPEEFMELERSPTLK